MPISLISKSSGAAALSAVLLIGGIIAEVAIAGLLSAYLVSQEGLGLRASNAAFFAAEAGINDALLKIARYGNQVGTESYQISVRGNVATISITKSTDPNTNDYVYQISSEGVSLSKKRKIQTNVIVDKNTGLVQPEETSEIAP